MNNNTSVDNKQQTQVTAITTVNQEVNNARQQHMIDVLNRQTVTKYLKSLQQQSKSHDLQQSHIKSESQFGKGSSPNIIGTFGLSKNSLPVPKNLYSNYKIAQQKQKQMELKTKRQQVNRKLRFLDEQIRCGLNKESSDQQPEIEAVLTKQEHQHRVKQLTAAWIERKRRQKQLEQQLALKQKDQQMHQQKLRQLEKQKQAQLRRRLIQTKIQQRKNQHQQFINQQQKLDQQLIDVKQKDRLYVKMQQHYVSQVVIPTLEDRKNKLKQIRDFSKRYDTTLIKQHEKQYLSARSSPRSADKVQESQDKKWKPPPRTAKLSLLLQQEKLRQQQKLEQRKKKWEEHIRREQNFLNDLKSKVKLIIDPAKKQEIERRIIQEQNKKNRPVIHANRLGEAYLQMAKKAAKPQHLRNSGVSSKSTEEQKTIRQLKNFLPSKSRSPEFYEQQRKKKVEDILNSDYSLSDKCHFLKMETDKLQEKIRQQQELGRVNGQDEGTGDLLLCSIQAKMGLIQLFKGQNQDQ